MESEGAHSAPLWQRRAVHQGKLKVVRCGQQGPERNPLAFLTLYHVFNVTLVAATSAQASSSRRMTTVTRARTRSTDLDLHFIGSDEPQRYFSRPAVQAP